MYKYIVSWLLISITHVTPPPTKDEFGREPMIINTVLHTQTFKTSKKKEFFTREEAFDFYYRAKKQEIGDVMIYQLGGSIDSVKIDSIKLKKIINNEKTN